MRDFLPELLRDRSGPEARNLLREYLQAVILASLQRSGAMIPLAFHGGTALRFLHSIRRLSEDLDFDTFFDEIRATTFGLLNDGTNVTDTIDALAFNGGNVLYGARDVAGPGEDLIRISTLSGAVTRIGDIQVDGNPSDIYAWDFDQNDNLYGLEATVAGNRVVQVDVADPDASVAVTAAASSEGTAEDYADGCHYAFEAEQSARRKG